MIDKRIHSSLPLFLLFLLLAVVIVVVEFDFLVRRLDFVGSGLSSSSSFLSPSSLTTLLVFLFLGFFCGCVCEEEGEGETGVVSICCEGDDGCCIALANKFSAAPGNR